MKYEEAAARLKAILAELESDKLGMAESLKLYEEGLALSKVCLEEMKVFKGKIALLNKEYSKLVEKEFDITEDKEEGAE